MQFGEIADMCLIREKFEAIQISIKAFNFAD
jgi:hypothetical protein